MTCFQLLTAAGGGVLVVMCHNRHVVPTLVMSNVDGIRIGELITSVFNAVCLRTVAWS